MKKLFGTTYCLLMFITLTFRFRIHALLIFALLVLTGLAAKAEDFHTIEGQVFVRTRGGETIKLSLVDVELLELKEVAANVEGKKTAAQPVLDSLVSELEHASQALSKLDILKENEQWRKANDEVYRIQGIVNYLNSAFYFITKLPKPLQSAVTDADGKFSFKATVGSYCIMAATKRSVGSKTEFYHWLIKVAVDSDKKVMLANSNLATNGSDESVILAQDCTGLPVADPSEALALVAKAQESAVLAAAQQKAIDLYPELSVAGSRLNKEFVDRVKRYRTEKRDFFIQPDWPVRLAKECSEVLADKSGVK